jgi:hypothetical protein
MSETVFDPGLVGRVLANGESKRAVNVILKREKASAKRLLRGNAKLVMALRDALLDREELIGDAILEVLDEAGGKRAQTAARRASKSRPARAAATARAASATRTRSSS